MIIRDAGERGSVSRKMDIGNDDGSAVRPVNAANPLALRLPSRCGVGKDRMNSIEGWVAALADLNLLLEAEYQAVPARAQRFTVAEMKSLGRGKERTGSAGRTGTRSEENAHCTREKGPAGTVI